MSAATSELEDALDGLEKVADRDGPALLAEDEKAKQLYDALVARGFTLEQFEFIVVGLTVASAEMVARVFQFAQDKYAEGFLDGAAKVAPQQEEGCDNPDCEFCYPGDGALR